MKVASSCLNKQQGLEATKKLFSDLYFSVRVVEGGASKVQEKSIIQCLDFEVKIVDKVLRQSLEARQSRFSRFYSSDNRDRNGIIICTIP